MPSSSSRPRRGSTQPEHAEAAFRHRASGHWAGHHRTHADAQARQRNQIQAVGNKEAPPRALRNQLEFFGNFLLNHDRPGLRLNLNVMRINAANARLRPSRPTSRDAGEPGRPGFEPCLGQDKGWIGVELEVPTGRFSFPFPSQVFRASCGYLESLRERPLRKPCNLIRIERIKF